MLMKPTTINPQIMVSSQSDSALIIFSDHSFSVHRLK